MLKCAGHRPENLDSALLLNICVTLGRLLRYAEHKFTSAFRDINRVSVGII